jgi:ABC-type sugar transport system ATPase subunit
MPVRRIDGHWTAADGTPLMPAEPVGASEALLGVRPEDILLDSVVDSRVLDTVQPARDARVKLVEHTGPTTTLACDWAGAHVHIVVTGPVTLRSGDRIQPRIVAARAVLFDPKAGGFS